MSTHRHVLVVAAAVSFVATLSLPVTAAADTGDPPAAGEQAAVAEPGPSVAPDPRETDPTTEAEPPTEPSTDVAPPTEPEPPTEAESPTEPAEPAEPTAPDPPAVTEEPVVEPEDEAAVPTPEAEGETAAAAAVRVRTPEPKVTICHRTTSRTNPYNQIVVSEESAIEGHSTHTGPIFSPDVDTWGDVIPPIRPGLRHGLNWPEGRSVLDNGCEVQPDVGPLPEAAISDVTCDAATGSVTVTVRNGETATAPAFFTILLNGTNVQTVGPVRPGASERVVLSGDVSALEDQTFTITVRSGGEVIASRVVTVDCQAAPPDVEIAAQLACVGTTAQGTAVVTNNGPDPVVVTAQVDGAPVGTPSTVAPGATATGTVDLSPHEDRTVVVSLFVDGTVAAVYTVTPDCVAPRALARVAVDGVVCPPPSSTVTLANEGDPDSTIVFSIRIDGKVVQVSAPIYGGDSTTIVGDLTGYEDQRVTVELLADGEVLGSRTVSVDCVSAAGRQQVPAAGATGGAGATAVPTAVAAGSPPAARSGADRTPAPFALGLVALGALLLLAGGRRSRRPKGP